MVLVQLDKYMEKWIINLNEKVETVKLLGDHIWSRVGPRICVSNKFLRWCTYC